MVTIPQQHPYSTSSALQGRDTSAMGIAHRKPIKEPQPCKGATIGDTQTRHKQPPKTTIKKFQKTFCGSV